MQMFRSISSYVFLAACLLFAGCRSVSDVGEYDGSGSTLVVNVNCHPHVRSTSSDGESSINSWSVLVCTTDGDVVAYRSGVSGAAEFDLECSTYLVYAVANSDVDVSAMTTSSQLTDAVIPLSDNSLSGGLVMYGSSQVTVVPEGSSISLQMSRLVSKISVDRVRFDFSAEPVLAGKPVTLDAIYLTNVAGSCSVGAPSAVRDWLCKMKWEPSSSSALLRDEVGVAVGEDDPYERTHHFYACENITASDSDSEVWCARYTRLVVECTVDGVKYYYPVSLPGISRNSHYRITDILVKGWGSKNPEKIQKGALDVSFSESIAWDETYNVKEES